MQEEKIYEKVLANRWNFIRTNGKTLTNLLGTEWKGNILQSITKVWDTMLMGNMKKNACRKNEEKWVRKIHIKSHCSKNWNERYNMYRQKKIAEHNAILKEQE